MNADKQENGIRLNKYLAECGVCSRRDADELIASGAVTVNGKAALMGQRIRTSDIVAVSGRQIGRESKVVLAFYKPVGVTCTERDTHAAKKVTDMIRCDKRVTYAGRLDKDSEGLLIMTNDGDLIDAMMRGANGHEKEYVVKVDRELTDDFPDQMRKGVFLKELDVTTRPCEAALMGKYTFRIILTQGLNRQIRRMCETLGYRVKSLKRVRVMNITLGDLKPGEYRQLEAGERDALYEMAGMNTKQQRTTKNLKDR